MSCGNGPSSQQEVQRIPHFVSHIASIKGAGFAPPLIVEWMSFRVFSNSSFVLCVGLRGYPTLLEDWSAELFGRKNLENSTLAGGAMHHRSKLDLSGFKKLFYCSLDLGLEPGLRLYTCLRPSLGLKGLKRALDQV